MPRAWLLVLASWTLLAATSCGTEATEGDPDSGVDALFALARDPERSRLDAWLARPVSRDQRVALHEVLDRLATMRPAVTGRMPLDEVGTLAVDLEAELEGEARARLSLHLRPAPGGGWHVLWIQGPGFAWPTPERRRNGGLSTSAPPH